MLVLSRKQQQEIIVGDNVKITVLKIKGNTVKLGIEAPPQVRVVRGELPAQTDVGPGKLTVVFNDRIDEARVAIVPFRKSPTTANGTQTSARETACTTSRQPSAHNRLKEIVHEISGK